MTYVRANQFRVLHSFQLMTAVTFFSSPKANLIYLGLLTDRIPILSQFVPVHVGGHVPPINFGEVFDLPRLRKELGWPILEWHDVKHEQSSTLDDLGCWSVWQAVNIRDPTPRGSRSLSDIGLGA
jgi:hypothetical protein